MNSLTILGYSASPKARLWELHFFAIVAVVGFLFLYLALMPINAPVPLPWSMAMLFVFAVLPSVLFACWRSPSKQGPESEPCCWLRWVRGIFIALPTMVILAWFGFLVTRAAPRFARSMPTLASVLVLCILLTWFLAGLAFFFDIFRVPVLSFEAKR